MLIYWIDVLNKMQLIFTGIFVFCFVFSWLYALCVYGETYENLLKAIKSDKKIKSGIIVSLIALLLVIAIPDKDTMYQMLITQQNITTQKP